MSLWLYEAAPWYDEATNTLYVPASWTAGQVVDFLTEYAHDLNNPMGRRFLAELQTNGIFSGRIGFEEYNSLLKQGLAATAEQAEGLIRQAISLGPGGDLALAAWDAQNDGIISAALTFAKNKSQDLALGASLGVMIGVVAKRLNAPVKGLTLKPTLLQKDLDHIIARHWATSGARGAGKFLDGTTGKNLLDMVNDAVRRGASRPNTNGRAGTIFELDFGRQIGTDIAGNIATKLRVVLRPDGTVKTAFPF